MRASTGAEKIHSALHPEKSWFTVSGRGFDSRHLHHHGHVARYTRPDEGPDQLIGPLVSTGATTVAPGGTLRVATTWLGPALASVAVSLRDG